MSLIVVNCAATHICPRSGRRIHHLVDGRIEEGAGSSPDNGPMTVYAVDICAPELDRNR
ncbi:MAG: hypothetical protein ACE367_27130 [Acidimicrobiales bacterium]